MIHMKNASTSRSNAFYILFRWGIDDDNGNNDDDSNVARYDSTVGQSQVIIRHLIIVRHLISHFSRSAQAKNAVHSKRKSEPYE